MPRSRFFDSSIFWLALGGVVVTLGGILLGVGSAKAIAAKDSLWSSGWFVAGFTIMLAGCLALVWALVLFLVQRQIDARLPKFEQSQAPLTPNPSRQELDLSDLGQQTIDGRTLWISDQVKDGPVPPIIHGRKFVRCTIKGPAILLPRDGVTFSDCTWDEPAEGVIMPIPALKGDLIFGVIGVAYTKFEHCYFVNVPLMVPAERVDEMWANFNAKSDRRT